MSVDEHLKNAVRLGGLCLCALFLLALTVPLLAGAQTQAGAGLAPTLIERGAEPGETFSETLTVSNLSDETQTYFLYARDISGVRAGGSPIFADEGMERTGFELTEWVTLSDYELTLSPGDEQSVTVTITVPSEASPGSHFGGVVVSLEPPRLRTVGAGVGFEVANIISIRVAGDAVESAQIRSFSTDKRVYGETLVNFTARVENKGNVLVRPTGLLEVTNMFGERVVLMRFNEAAGGVFPGSVRDFAMVWEDETPGLGRYEAKVSLVYGEAGVSQQTVTHTTSFWILPMNIIQPLLITLAVTAVTIYLLVWWYIRRRIQALSGRRVVRRRASSTTPVFTIALVVTLMVTALFLLILLFLFA
jgi:hypothetical protein